MGAKLISTPKSTTAPGAAQGIDTSNSPALSPGAALGTSAAAGAARDAALVASGAEPPSWLEEDSRTSALRNEQNPAPKLGDPPTLTKRLAELNASGFELQMRAGFTTGMRDDPLNASMVLNAQRKFHIGASSTPLEQINYVVGSNHELPPQLRTTSKLDVYPLQLKSSVIGEGRGKVSVVNHLSPELKPFYEAEVALDKDNRIITEDQKRIEREFVDTYRNGREGLKAQFTTALSTPTAPAAHAVTLDHTKPLTDAELAPLNRLFEEGFAVTAVYVPDQGSVDRSISGGILSKDYNITLSPEAIDRLKGAHVGVNGDIQEITLARAVPIHEIVNNPKTDELATVNGRAAYEVITDRHGNRISRSITPYIGGESGIESILIQPPIVSSSAEHPTSAPLAVDLTHFGAGELPPIFTRIPYRELAPIGERTAVTNMALDRVTPDMVGRLARVGEGISRAEKLFGAAPGSLGDRIALLNSDNPNASFSPKNPTTVVVQDEMLTADMPPDVVGFHETAHLIDGGTGYTLSGGAFHEQYQTLKAANSPLLSALNERNFLPDTGIGGHAEANHLELFASLTNTLDYAARDPKGWGERVAAFTPEMRRDYRKTLEVFVQNLESTPAKPGQQSFRSSPIAAIARQRIEILTD